MCVLLKDQGIKDAIVKFQRMRFNNLRTHSDIPFAVTGSNILV